MVIRMILINARRHSLTLKTRPNHSKSQPPRRSVQTFRRSCYQVLELFSNYLYRNPKIWTTTAPTGPPRFSRKIIFNFFGISAQNFLTFYLMLEILGIYCSKPVVFYKKTRETSSAREKRFSMANQFVTLWSICQKSPTQKSRSDCTTFWSHLIRYVHFWHLFYQFNFKVVWKKLAPWPWSGPTAATKRWRSKPHNSKKNLV